MNAIRLLNYKAKFGDHHIIDDLISMTTKLFNWNTPPYSHSEIQWPDEEGDWSNGACFTSTLRDDWKGTVIRPASQVLTHPERWDYIEILVDPIRLAASVGLAKIAARNNRGYDYTRLFAMALHLNFGSKGKDVCSELSERFMVWCGIFPKETKPSPRRLCRNTMRLGYKPICLSAQ